MGCRLSNLRLIKKAVPPEFLLLMAQPLLLWHSQGLLAMYSRAAMYSKGSSAAIILYILLLVICQSSLIGWVIVESLALWADE